MASEARWSAVAVAAGLVLAGCSGGAAGHARASLRLVSQQSCSDLLNGLRRATSAQVGPYGLPGTGAPMPLTDGRVPGTFAAKGQDHSGTNVQESGVDEPDLVKTDGRRIVTATDGRLRVVDAATRKVTGTVALPGGRPYGTDQLLMSGDRVLVVTRPIVLLERENRPPRGPVPPRESWPRMTLIDISGAPRVLGTMTVRGSYVDARQAGSTARLVLRSTPDIDFPARPPGTSTAQATAANRKIVQRAPLSAWLPAYDVTAGGRTEHHSVPCDQVSHPDTYTGTSMLSVFTVDLAAGLGDGAPMSVAADGDTVYESGSSLYVTGQRSAATDVYRFDAAGRGRPRFAAAGTVPGSVLNQYSLSEYGGRLRITTTRDRAGSAVYVLERRGRRLVTVGSVGGLGRGERVYAVRFIGPVGYVVTFRQTDPLYTLDLRDPAHPRTTGQLKITGYSAYLHPAGDGRLIGVGQEADAAGRTRGAQVCLFDVHDPARPKKIGGYRLGTGSALADVDPHAFLYWPATGLTVMPTSEGALVLSVSPSSVRKVGVLRPRADYTMVERSLLIGTTLWTMTSSGLQANDAASLRQIAWIPLR